MFKQSSPRVSEQLPCYLYGPNRKAHCGIQVLYVLRFELNN